MIDVISIDGNSKKALLEKPAEDKQSSGVGINKIHGQNLAPEIQARLDSLIIADKSAIAQVLGNAFPIKKDHLESVTPQKVSEFKAGWDLYENSFAPDERRDLYAQVEAMKDPRYEMYSIKWGEQVIGFIGLWHLEVGGEDWIFGEHMAIHPSFQKKGIGTNIMRLAAPIYAGKNIVFEFEYPDNANPDDPKNIRIHYFKSQGFHLNDQKTEDGIGVQFDYIQPSYSKDKKPVPLILGTAPSPIRDQAQFEAIREQIYKVVYNLPEGKLPKSDLEQSTNVN